MPRLSLKTEKCEPLSGRKIYHCKPYPTGYSIAATKRTVAIVATIYRTIFRQSFIFRRNGRTARNPVGFAATVKIKPETNNPFFDNKERKLTYLSVARSRFYSRTRGAFGSRFVKRNYWATGAATWTRDKRKSVNPDTLIRNLAELKIGQPVVTFRTTVKCPCATKCTTRNVRNAANICY